MEADCYPSLVTAGGLADAFARQNAGSSNPKVHMLAAQRKVTAGQAAVDNAKQALERAAECAKMGKQEQPAATKVGLQQALCNINSQDNHNM